MISHISGDFRRDFERLPIAVKKQARAMFRIFIADPAHPSLRFKKLPPHADIWSVRITGDYRVIGRRRGDSILWFFIGTHAEYDKAMDRLDT